MKSQNFGFAVLLVAALTLGGCSTVTNPGAPDQSFDIDQDIQALEAIFEKGPTITDFYANPTETGRNKFISGRLTLMNIQYIKFIRRFAVEKAQLDTAADILIIGVNLAGTLVGAATTKGILAAISGGTAASRTSINKNFFHEKTVPVLITAMNAERQTALIPIMEGTAKSLKEYPFERALSHLHSYYLAGTFIGALQAIQRDSGAKEEKAVITLRGITAEAVTKEASDRRKALMNTIDGLDPDKAIALLPKIEDEFPEIKPFMAAYTDEIRAEDAETGSKAKELLKQAVPLTAKSRDDADKWQAAIDSL